MPIIARDKRKEFTPAPEGLHQAVCVDVVELGMVETPWGKKRMVRLCWQINEELEVNGKRQRFVVMQRYNPSLNEKANLRKHLEAWRGKRFTKEELEGFDLEKLIGANCQLTIVHNVTEGGTYANVSTIVPLGRGMQKITPDGYIRVKDREDENEHDETQGPGYYDDEDIPF